MRTLVKSLKRLYEQGRITEEKLLEMVDEGKITQEEYDYIVGEAVEES